MSEYINIARLRKDAPTWTWKAERFGMGWQYKGSRGDERVTVYAVSVLSGPSEDDYATQWRVDDGCAAVGYSYWYLARSKENK